MPAYTMYTHTGTHTLIFPDRAGVKQTLLLSGTCFGFAFQISLFFTSVRRRCGRGGGRRERGLGNVSHSLDARICDKESRGWGTGCSWHREFY